MSDAGQIALRRHTSAPPGPSSESGDDVPPVDLKKLAVLTTAYSIVEGLLTYPYDLVKTRQQMAPPGSRVLRLSTTAYVHTIIREQGPASLYRGFGWSVLGGVPSEVAYYATYTQAKHAMLQTPLGQQYPSAVFATAGLISDVVGVLLWVPADVVSQRVQMLSVADGAASTTPQIASAQPQHAAIGAEGASAAVSVSSSSSMDPWGRRPLRALRDLSAFPAAAPPPPPTTIASTSRPSRVPMLSSGGAAGPSFYATLQPPSGIEIAWRICMREGPLGLWRGTFATMLSLAPNSALWWLTHEESKQRISKWLQRREDDAIVHGLSGTLAGIVSTVATNPLDVVKTRLQCSESAVSATDVLKGLLNESGWRGLYSGLIPRLASAVPRSICTVLAYERAIAMCTKSEQDR